MPKPEEGYQFNRARQVFTVRDIYSEMVATGTGYAESIGDYSHVERLHRGSGPHEQIDSRAVATFVLALDDAEIATDPRLRIQLIAWFTWTTHDAQSQ